MRFKFDTLVVMSCDSGGRDCEGKMRGGVRVVRWRKAATAWPERRGGDRGSGWNCDREHMARQNACAG
jgi:hypothetical protein